MDFAAAARAFPDADRLELAWRAPEDAFAPLAGEAYALLLHGGRRSRSFVFAFPDRVIEGPAQAALGAVRAAAAERAVLAGLFGYEAGAAFDRVPALDPAPWPALALGVYPAHGVYDPVAGRAWIEGAHTPAGAALAKALSAPAASPGLGLGAPLAPQWPKARYLDAAGAARAYVRAGDVFQVNLAHPFKAQIAGDAAPYAVFQRLIAASPAAYAAYFRLDPDRVVMTNSPELFVRLEADGRVETRPIKGTRPRGASPEADARLAAALQASVKDRAENLMIVDLMRNDLSRVCAPGSVKTPRLFAVESLSNVHHLVSTVTGRLQPGAGPLDLLAASFPAGSITGAPKVRAMEIIAELEGAARGPYCGSMGWIGPDGAMTLNVMIRTAAFLREGPRWRVTARSGGAITTDSDPEAELAETHAKIAALKRAIGG